MYIENENSNIPAQIPINSKCTTSSSNFCAMKMPSCTSTSTCGDPNEKVISVIDPESNLIIDKPTDSMAKQDDVMIEKVLLRLRWLTLGHQYNWTKKEYHFDRVPEVPESIKSLSYEIVKSFEHIIHYDPKLWRPEAGIVNFYQPGDSLMAHQDKSEINTTAPLLSISLGLECVFLIGTDDRKDKPMALKLQSGDLIIMSGNSRRAFHGVPRLLENTCPEFLLSDNPEWINFKDYLSHTRLNVNLRQVF
jgi:alkylated DNA repair protein alkB family protein 1